MEVDKRRNLKLKFEIASYLGRTTLRVSMIPRFKVNIAKKKTPYDPYDGRKRLLTDGFDGMYMLVYRPVAGSI